MSRIMYPEWQKTYEDALLEADPQKLPHRVSSAETAIFQRLETVRGVPEGRLELQAIQDALNSLSVLKKETEHRSEIRSETRPESRAEHSSQLKPRTIAPNDGSSASE
jgi:hypothetical protein